MRINLCTASERSGIMTSERCAKGSEILEFQDHFAPKITGFGQYPSKLQLFLCHAEALKCMLAHCANPGFIARFQLGKHGFHRSERPIAQKKISVHTRSYFNIARMVCGRRLLCAKGQSSSAGSTCLGGCERKRSTFQPTDSLLIRLITTTAGTVCRAGTKARLGVATGGA